MKVIHSYVFVTLANAIKISVGFYRSDKPRNRPSFRQIQMHLEIASPDLLNIPTDEYFQYQVGIVLSGK